MEDYINLNILVKRNVYKQILQIFDRLGEDRVEAKMIITGDVHTHFFILENPARGVLRDAISAHSDAHEYLIIYDLSEYKALPKRTQNLIRRAINYLKSEYGEDLTLGEIRKAARKRFKNVHLGPNSQNILRQLFEEVSD